MSLWPNINVREAIKNTDHFFLAELLKKKISSNVSTPKMEKTLLAGDWYFDRNYVDKVYYSRFKFGTILLFIGYNKVGKETVVNISGKKI